MTKKFLFVMMLAMPLAACQTTVDTKHDKIIIEDPHSGDFCPPGQAKKGNC